MSVHSLHADHLKLQAPGESVPISLNNSTTNEYILYHTDTLFNAQSDRYTMSLKRIRTIGYWNLDSNLSCSSCGDYMN